MEEVFSSIQLLSQRVYEIQSCISCTINGYFNSQTISALNNKMTQIETSLRELEAIVSQYPDLNEIYAMIDDIKEIYDTCAKSRPDMEEKLAKVQLQNKTINSKKSPIQSSANPKSISNAHKTPPHKTNPNQLNNTISQNPPPQDESNEIEGEGTIQLVTERELSLASKSVNYRIPIDKLNTYIHEINAVLAKKLSIIKLQPNQVKASVRRLWERYKDEELMDDDRLFFTLEDTKETPTLKNNSQKVLSVLQALGRISCSTDGHVKRYFIR